MRNMVRASLATAALVTAMMVTGIAQNGGGGSQPAAAETSVPCAVTQPNGKGPPPQNLNHFYGNDSLAVDLWPDGTIVFKPDGGGFVKRDGSLGMKFAWWRGVRGELTIDGRRLDKSIASRPRAESQPRAYPEMEWLPTYLIFPTPGCWEVTGRIGTASLTFVTRVVKIGDGPSWRPDEPDVQSPSPAGPSAAVAQSKPNFTGTWQILESSAKDAQAHLMIAQDGSAFVVTDTGADGSPEKLTYRLDGSDSANKHKDSNRKTLDQVSQAKWVNAAIVIATTINDDHGGTWEGMQVYSLNPEGRLSVTTFDGILTNATLMATTTRLYEKLPSGR
jgi:hypothetical protein